MTLRQLLCLRVASSLPEREFRVSPRFNPGQPGRVNLFANSGNSKICEKLYNVVSTNGIPKENGVRFGYVLFLAFA